MMKVVKSNMLIEAKYRVTLEEQRVILYLVSLVKPKDVDFKEYEISIKRFCELAELSSGTQYNKFKKISKSLISKVITIKEGTKTIVVSWLSSSVYDEGTGIVKLSFSPYLKPYLLQLKQNFTSYNLSNVLYLKSIYSIRLFELLKQYEKLSFRLFELDELKKILNVEDVKSYRTYADFKRFVILVAHKELKEKCDIYFEFEEIKQGRRVDKIKFLIYQNDKTDKQPRFVEQKISDELNTSVPIEASFQFADKLNFITEKLSESELVSIWESANGDIEIIHRRYEAIKQRKSIDNLVGFMVWAVKQSDEQFRMVDYKKKNKFVNFEGRNLDVDELERKEREFLMRSMIKEN